MNYKCISLLSGGLDSALATKMMLGLGLDVKVLNFKSPFCNCNGKKGCGNRALTISKKYNLPVEVVHLENDYIDIVKNPKYGYGKGMNPCIDCRILMFKKAKEVMEKEGASFIFTGEVVGQRPMSQRKHVMELIERESGLEGLILRPLSAKLMNLTLPERDGLVSREKLLAISGRSRKRLLSLAGEYDVDGFLCASSGCVLTEKAFAAKLKDLFSYIDSPTIRDTHLLRIGRHFRISEHCKIIVGRDEKENNILEHYINDEDYYFKVVDFNGPLVVAKGNVDESGKKIISKITIRYSDSPKGQEAAVVYNKNTINKGERIYPVTAIDDGNLNKLRI